jgi:hypothetical protein
MTKDDIIRMAGEAGFYIDQDWIDYGFPGFERFAILVAAAERERLEATAWGASQKWIKRAIEAEREACAKVCDDWPVGRDDVYSIGQAIRARGRA